MRHPHPMNYDEIRAIAPSVFAEAPASHVSPDYHFVQTSKVLDMLLAEGWEVIGCSQQNVRLADKALGTKHSVKLRKAGWAPDNESIKLGQLFPVIEIINSHDWSSKLKMVLGMLRLLCLNGLMGLAGGMGTFSMRHDHIPEDLAKLFENFAALVDMMMARANRWQSIILDDIQRQQFLQEAAILRFGEEYRPEHVIALGKTRRYQDEANTLWNVYNVAQENAICGGVKVSRNVRRVRELTNIQAVSDLNFALIEVANRFDPTL